MQKIYLKKVIDLNNQLKELVSISVDESINYKMESQGMRAYGSIMINGDYKTSSSKKDFHDSIDLDIVAQYSKIEDRNDFVVKIEDFDYYLNEGNLSLVIEAFIYGVKDDEDRVIETNELIEEYSETVNHVEELMRIEEIEIVNEPIKEEMKEVYADKKIDIDKDVLKVPFVSKIVKTSEEEIEENEDLGTYYLYVVQNGDTYRSISNKYKVDEYMIKSYNHERSLEKGTIVIIPYS